MSKMISVASGFQYSVNIGYDLNNDDKLKNFIPTKSALTLLKDILSSTAPDSTERARVLVGAYGKGKSHIVLTILSMLMQRERSLFTHLMPKITEDPELNQLVENYYSHKENKILPVIINGTSGSLSQAFLLETYKKTAEEFQSGEVECEDSTASAYEIRFRSDDGSSEVKRFDRVETSKRGQLLYNSILSEIDSMGYSISEQEKRQILMDILKGMC